MRCIKKSGQNKYAKKKNFARHVGDWFLYDWFVAYTFNLRLPVRLLKHKQTNKQTINKIKTGIGFSLLSDFCYVDMGKFGEIDQ